MTFNVLEAAKTLFVLPLVMASMATMITSALSTGVRYFLKN